MAKNEVVKTENTAVADLSAFAEYAGAGLEQVSAQDINIPYIQILQSGSPQCKKGNEKRIEGATEGDVIATGVNRLYKVDETGNSTLNVAIVSKVTLLTEWAQNRGGLQGHHSLAKKDELGIKKAKNADGKDILVLPNGNEIVETDYLFCVALPNDNETPYFCIMPAKATQRTAVRQLFTQLMFDCQNTLPTFAFVYTVGTGTRTKDTYSWIVPKFTKVTSNDGVSYVDSRGVLRTTDKFGKQLFDACTQFLKAIKAAGGPEKFLSRTSYDNYETAEDTSEAAGEVI